MDPSRPDSADMDAPPRRAFLKHALGAAAALAIGGPRSLALGADKPATSAPAPLATAPAKARVVQVADHRMLPVRVVQRPFVRDYLMEGLRLFTGTTTIADAWHRILKPDDVVLVKFNASGARQIGTSEAVASELVKLLIESGWKPEQLMLIEEVGGLSRARKTRRPDLRWQGRVVEFGASGRDTFVAALDEATAIINVPFLKTHHLATMTCCLKNLSHGLIRHPSRFHGNGCDPAIGEIAASEPIRSKLKFNIVNGLRVPFDRGAEAGAKDMAPQGILLFGEDPVACDAAGYGILNEIRALRELKPLLPAAGVPPQLVTAHRLGLGQYDSESVDILKLPS